MNIAEAKTLQEEIAQGVKLKAIPKAEKEKSPIRFKPVSNNAQLKMAIQMRNELESIQASESNEEEFSF